MADFDLVNNFDDRCRRNREKQWAEIQEILEREKSLFRTDLKVHDIHVSIKDMQDESKESKVYDTKFHVVNTTTLDACMTFSKEFNKVHGCLVFASEKKFGGGIVTKAQEESFARYTSYMAAEELFKKTLDKVMYMEKVRMLRHPKTNGISERKHWVAFPCVRAAAIRRPKLRRDGTLSADARIESRTRIRRILYGFWKHGITCIVLGAWGSGVFQNPPRCIAELFCEELHGTFKGKFEHVVFAVLDSFDGKNIRTYKEVFDTTPLTSSTGHSIPDGALTELKKNEIEHIVHFRGEEYRAKCSF